MISLLFSIPLFFGWMTDEMIYQEEQKEIDANIKRQAGTPPPRRGERQLPNPNSQPQDLTPGMANSPGGQDSAGTIKTNTANQQGIYWLALLDQQQYGPSYVATAPLLQDVISRPQWIAAMKGTRQPLGTVRSRKLTSTTRMNQLAAGTQGNFTQLTYSTQFSGGNGQEVLTLMGMSGPGNQTQWKVVSYHVVQ